MIILDMIILPSENLTKVQIPRVRIRLSRVSLIWIDKNTQGRDTHCRVTQGKSDQGIITQGNYRVTPVKLCVLFMHCINKHYVKKYIV